MDPKFVLLAVVVVLVLVVVWKRNSAYRDSQRRRLYERRPYSRLRLRTGDLLLFDSAAFNAPIKWVTLSPYSHAGVVLMIAGVPHVAEISRPGVPFLRKPGVAAAGGKPLPAREFVHTPRGATVLPLAPRLRDYSGRVFVAQLDRRLSPAQEQKIARAAFDDRRPFASALDQIAGAGLGLWRPRTLHCCQHVARILNAGGAHLVDRPGAPRRPLPETALVGSMRALAAPSQIRFSGGASYEPPVEILRDLGTT